MASGDLVRLADVKAWLGIDPTDTSSDALLSSWITKASQAVINEIGRGPTLGFRTITETRDGNNGLTMALRFWPVLSVTALSINGSAVNQQTDKPFGSGYFWEAWTGDDTQGHQYIGCACTRFYRDLQNIVITYNAGYQVQGEQYTISNPPSVGTARPWYSDQGVTFVGGAALTYIATGTPATGQYTLDPTTGVYTFAVADEGREIAITYSYVPESLQQATIGIISWQWKQKDRIGVVSKSLGGQETMSYSQQPMDSLTAAMLQPFKSVIPL